MRKIIFINILFIIIFFFTVDYSVFKIQSKKFNLKMSYIENMTKKIAASKNADIRYLTNDLPERKSYNTQNKNKKSIVYTGCSFIWGEGLEEEQTVSYKTSILVDNPVYNLGFISRAINTTIGYIQYNLFFDKVKIEPAVIIYNYADFHLKRLVMPNMAYERNEFLYIIKDNDLVRKKPPFIISRFPSLALIREYLHEFNINKNPKYKEYLKQLLKLHFSKAKKLINEKYPNTKFIITVYYNSPIFEEISDELEKEGFIIIRLTPEEFGLDTTDKKYLLLDGHPNEKVWEIVTPKLIERINKYL